MLGLRRPQVADSVQVPLVGTHVQAPTIESRRGEDGCAVRRGPGVSCGQVGQALLAGDDNTGVFARAQKEAPLSRACVRVDLVQVAVMSAEIYRPPRSNGSTPLLEHALTQVELPDFATVVERHRADPAG